MGSDGGESSDVSESGVTPRQRLRVGKPVLVAIGVVLVVVAGVVGYLVFGYKSTVTERGVRVLCIFTIRGMSLRCIFSFLRKCRVKMRCIRM